MFTSRIKGLIMQCGFIKLHRQILDWEWYDDPNTMRLFLHCLLRANHKDNNWRGILIKRGSFLTSLETLSKETKLTVSQIRTAFKKLKSTNEIASLSQARNRMVTIINYESYQGSDKLSDKLIAGSSQADDKLIATNKNDKNEKNEKNVNKKEAIDYSKLMLSDNEIDELIRIRKKNKGGAITKRVVSGLVKEFDDARAKGMTSDDILTEWETRGWKSFKAEWVKEGYGQQANNSDFSPAVQRTINNIMNVELD